MEPLVLGEHTYELQRWPLKPGDRLRAWDAADEYLLREFTATTPTPPPGQLLLVNDGFGALAVALHRWRPVVWSDSFISRQALAHNSAGNGLPGPGSDFVPADEDPVGPFSAALIKLPKSLAFCEDQLLRLRRLLAPGAVVWTGGMIKHTPQRAYRLLADIIGPTTTTLGWKKARLARSTAAGPPHGAELPDHLPPASYGLPGTALELVNLPNVFSREKLDLGTRLLLSHLPRGEQVLAAADLGCGNGVLAVALAQACPRAEILGIDESYQAVASARLNAALLGPDQARLTFRAGDGLTGEPDASRDLVLCNPPFHHAQTTGDLLAWHMFTDAARVLRPGGELRIVGNRHLGYHAKLQRLFDRVELVAQDNRFVILSAIRSSSRP